MLADEARKLFTIFRDAGGGRRMSLDELSRSPIQKWRPDKPGGRREFGSDRGHQARFIVALMDGEAPVRIASADERQRDAGGLASNDGLADPQLRLSQRGHGGAPRPASRLPPHRHAQPRLATWRTMGCRYPIRSRSASDRT